MISHSDGGHAGLAPILLPTATGHRRSALMVAGSATVLRRFYFLQRTIIRLEAGWMPALEDWAAKLLLPEIIWQDGLVSRSLRERILELRYPERRLEPEADGAQIEFYAALADAPGDLALMMALARVVKPHVRALFADYLGRSDALDDAPSAHFLEHAVADLDRQIAKLHEVVEAWAGRRADLTAAAQTWCAAVAEVVQAVSPDHFHRADPEPDPVFAGRPVGGRPFAIARHGVRDRRFCRVRFAWPDRHTPQPPGTGLQLQVRQAVHHLNEVWAAEMAAACIYDFMDRAPHDFLDDATRWCFDEIRHCRMGYERLREWGFQESEMPLDSFSYDAGADADPLVRLGIIFFFETTYIHTKPERARIFGEVGDRLSSHDMDFDWADELIHTHYGKRWLDYFLAAEGAGRKVAEIKQLSEQAVIARQRSATAPEQAETQAVFERLLATAQTGSSSSGRLG